MGKHISEKIFSIAQILGLIEETHRDKNWLWDQIKKQHVKTSAKFTMNSYEILMRCNKNFVSKLLHVLKGEDIEGFESIKTLTKTYHWFFTDIVSASGPKLSTKEQVHKIVVLNELISRTHAFQGRDQKSTVLLPTGDGMAIGFADSPENPLQLAIELQKGLFRYNQSRRGNEKVLVRIGIDMGPVYFVKDITGKDNVWGQGIIMTRRVMDLAREMQILTSDRIADNVKKLSAEYKEIMHEIGDYSVKHGEELLIYNVFGEGFGNRVAPTKSKIAEANPEKDIKSEFNFAFNGVEIHLEILDSKTWLTHHTWIWNIVNISKEPKEQIFYFLDGDIPKNFSDMNVKVTDERDNVLEILSLGKNKPTHKEFNVQLNRPVLPKQRKILKLEYDWEEPDRSYFYRFASGTKKFKYVFIIQKGMETKNRILKVDSDTGYKILATPPPVVKYEDSKTVLSWEKNNILAHDGYQFDW